MVIFSIFLIAQVYKHTSQKCADIIIVEQVEKNKTKARAIIML